MSDPMASASVAQLTARLCEVEANMAALGELGAQLRAAIRDRAIARWREDGAAPTYRVDGLGTVSLPVPKPKVVVDDAAAFASWVADHHPQNVTCAVTAARVPADRLGEVIDAFRRAAAADPDLGLELERITAQIVVMEAWQKHLLDTATAAEGLALAAGTGDVIDGVKVLAGADPKRTDGPQPASVSVRIEPQAKADAAAAAKMQLAGVLERGLVISAGADLADAPFPDAPADDATGEPDDDPVCCCRCPRSAHKGKKRAGGCTTHDGMTEAGAPFCGRFKPAQSVWATP